MFEDRLALLEGAEAAAPRRPAWPSIHASLMGLVRAGDHVVAGRALFGSCRWLIAEWLPRFGVETTFVDATDLKAWEAAIRPGTKAVLIETPSNPVLEITDIARGVGAGPRGRRQGHRRQRLRHPDLPAAAEAGRRHRGLFGHQAHRRPGPGAGRGHPDQRGDQRGVLPRRPAPHRPVAVAVQRLGPGQGPGDPGPARAPPERHRRGPGRRGGPAQGGQAGAVPVPRRPPRRTTSPRPR